MPRIAPRAVLLIRGMKGNASEALNPVYRDAGAPRAPVLAERDAGAQNPAGVLAHHGPRALALASRIALT